MIFVPPCPPKEDFFFENMGLVVKKLSVYLNDTAYIKWSEVSIW